MSDVGDWVVLVECHDVGELHALRATLEAHGVPCRIHGEHTHGIMGAIHGSMVRSRVLVPRPALEVARELVTDIVGPFDEPSSVGADDDADDESPYRQAAELAPEPEHEAPERDPEVPAPRLKSYGRLVLVVLLVVGPLFGLAHLYAGCNRQAGVLALFTLVAAPAAFQGASWALLLLAGIWLADIIGGALGIAEHNRRVQAAASSGRAAPRALTAQ
jgi:hypothetical protein